MNDAFDMNLEPANGNLVDTLRKHCEEAVELEKVVLGYESAMKAAKARLHKLRTMEIPEAMSEAGIGDTFSIATGHEIKLSQFVSGSLPKGEEDRKRAIGVLVQHGGAGLIKTVVSAAFGKGESVDADAAAGLLKAAGFEVNEKTDVHAMSLQAFAREKLAEGDDLPMDTLGLYTGTVAKIKAPK